MRIATPAFFCFLFAWNIFSRPLTFSLYVSLGYASSIAWNIDNSDVPEILGTIAGDDTIFIVIKEGVKHQDVVEALTDVVPNMK